jgi:hypothetical protein
LKILSFNKEWIQKAQLLAGHFGHSVLPLRGIDASPHTNYLPNF